MKVLYAHAAYRSYSLACAWRYADGPGITAALRSAGVDVVELPTFVDLQPPEQAFWEAGIRRELRGARFDQVWIDVLRPAFTPLQLEFLTSLAPLSLGLVQDPIDGPASLEPDSASAFIRQRTLQRLRCCTHAAFADELDQSWFAALGAAPSAWLPPSVPASAKAWRSRTVASMPTACFPGSLTPARRKLLEAAGIMASTPPHDADAASAFDRLDRELFTHSPYNSPGDLARRTLSLYSKALAALHLRRYEAWLDHLSRYPFVVDLPRRDAGLSARVVDAIAAGVPVIAPKPRARPKSAALWTDPAHVHHYAAGDPGTLCAALDALRTGPDAAADACGRARSALFERHTTEIRIATLLPWLGAPASDVGPRAPFTLADALDAPAPFSTAEIVTSAPGGDRLHEHAARARPTPQPQLTFIVAAYNVEATLQRALGTLATDADPSRCEVLIVNDGSTDDTRRIAEGFCRLNPNFRLVDQSNRGLGAVRNRGIELARGDYIAFCDGDDIFFPVNHLRLVDRMLEQDADFGVGLCYSQLAGGEIVDFWDSAIVRVLGRPDAATSRTFLKYLVQAAAWQKIASRHFLQSAQLRFTEGRLFEDVEFTSCALLATDRLCFETYPLVIYDAQRSGSITNRSDARRFEILDNLAPVFARLATTWQTSLQRLCLMTALMRTTLWCLDTVTPDLAPRFKARLISTFRRVEIRAPADELRQLGSLLPDPWDRRALRVVAAFAEPDPVPQELLDSLARGRP